MDINNIIVMQSGLRRPLNHNITAFIKAGGAFDEATVTSFGAKFFKPIRLVQFEDGKIYCVDGHHRLYYIWRSGRQIIFNNEFSIEDDKYERYMEINISNGWVTPFDPRTQVRLPDLTNFKNEVINLINNFKVQDAIIHKHRLAKAIDFINKSPHLFRTERKIYKVNELIYE